MNKTIEVRLDSLIKHAELKFFENSYLEVESKNCIYLQHLKPEILVSVQNEHNCA